MLSPPTMHFLNVFPIFLIKLKKFATLLPNNWLAETPQTLASRRLGRQSAERERISEIKLKHFLRVCKILQALAFRGRSTLSAFAPVGSYPFSVRESKWRYTLITKP
jgi:hypothetical protein